MSWLGGIRIWTILLLFALVCGAEEKQRFEKKWIISATALVAANLFDGYSSRNLTEENPLLRNASGTYGVSKGTTIKFAASAAFLGAQWLLLRRGPDHHLNRAFTITNSVLAGTVTAVAIHNQSLPTVSSEPSFIQPASASTSR